MDTATLDRLQETLTRQYAAHEELLRALQAQRQAIRGFDTQGLERLRDRCDATAQRIAELEDARVRLTGPGVRLVELAQRCPEPHRSRLVAISAGLRQLAEQAAAAARVNNAAVQNMLNHFHTVYQMLAGANRTAAYGANGQPGAAAGAFLVDAVA